MPGFAPSSRAISDSVSFASTGIHRFAEYKKDQRLLFGVARIKAALEAHCCASACRTGDALVDTGVFFDTGLVASLEGGQGFGKNEREENSFQADACALMIWTKEKRGEWRRRDYVVFVCFSCKMPMM